MQTGKFISLLEETRTAAGKSVPLRSKYIYTKGISHMCWIVNEPKRKGLIL